MNNLKGELQYQMSTGTWRNCDERTKEYLERCVDGDYHGYTMDEVIAELNNGKTVRNAPADWYSRCRLMPQPVEIVEDVEWVKCDCGHTVPKSMVMNASLGTACPNCYDRMSA